MSEQLHAPSIEPEALNSASAHTFYAHGKQEPRRRREAILANLFGLKGRLTRESYWLIYASCMVSALVSPLLNVIVFWPFLLALTWISSAAVVKRFHDRGKHGAWWFVSLIPFVGTIWILIECGLLAGDDAANQYGPKGMAPADLLR
jgi:uncharacterized membrane protein YhaH (DUF805 family)